MARRRYQRGTLFLRGKRQKLWVARWREDIILPDGNKKRTRKCEVLGTLADYKTKRLAERALEQRLSDVNSLTYKPRPTEPYKTYYWILAETGIRCGEACGLPVNNLLFDIGAIKISQKVWRGKIETVKSKKGNRLCEISPQLAEHLRGYVRASHHNGLGLLFATGNGTPWDADLVRKRKLYPLLEKLGIERCGFHAFRHGNETVMDGEGVPMATRQNRLGHSDAKTTMKYTHVVSEDGRKIAARFGELLAPSPALPIVTMQAGNA